jgi:hypothetical protein
LGCFPILYNPQVNIDAAQPNSNPYLFDARGSSSRARRSLQQQATTLRNSADCYLSQSAVGTITRLFADGYETSGDWAGVPAGRWSLLYVEFVDAVSTADFKRAPRGAPSSRELQAAERPFGFPSRGSLLSGEQFHEWFDREQKSWMGN